jgi:hypothetical protein
MWGVGTSTSGAVVKGLAPIPPLPRSMPPERVVLLVGWVAFHQSRNQTSEPVEFAERTAQTLLGVASRGPAHSLFRATQDDGWLQCEIPARVGGEMGNGTGVTGMCWGRRRQVIGNGGSLTHVDHLVSRPVRTHTGPRGYWSMMRTNGRDVASCSPR